MPGSTRWRGTSRTSCDRPHNQRWRIKVLAPPQYLTRQFRQHLSRQRVASGRPAFFAFGGRARLVPSTIGHLWGRMRFGRLST